MTSSLTLAEVLKRSDSGRLSQTQKLLRTQFKIFTRLRGLLRSKNSTGSNTATLIFSSTMVPRPSMDFR